MAESKVKSHSRRTKSGQVRVKEGKRKSIGKKLATGVGLVGLGLAGRKLTKEVIRQKAIRDFKPKNSGRIDYYPLRKDLGTYEAKVPYPGMALSESKLLLEGLKRKYGKSKVKPKTTVAEVRQTTQAVVDKAKEIKANKPKVIVDSKELETLKEINDALNSGEVGKDSIGVLRQEKREIADRIRGKSKPKTNKFLDQALTGQGYQSKPKPNVIDERIARIERQQKWDAKRGVVLRRKKLLEESLGKKVVDKTKGRLDFNPTPKSRKARKKAAKQLADAAKDLRSRGAYV